MHQPELMAAVPNAGSPHVWPGRELHEHMPIPDRYEAARPTYRRERTLSEKINMIAGWTVVAGIAAALAVGVYFMLR